MRSRFHFLFLILPLLAGWAVAEDPIVRTNRILVLGDSWAAGMTFALLGNPFQRAVEKVHPEAGVFATIKTAVPGSTAAQWASNHDGKLDAVRKGLEENPSIQIVAMTLGGNDFNGQAMRRDVSRLSDTERHQIYSGIRANLEKVIHAVQSMRAGVKIVLIDYDYFNLEANSTSPIKLNFHGLKQADYNKYLVELGREKMALCTETPGVYYVQSWGVFQHALGDPKAGYAVGELPLPGGPPDYEPYPGGDPHRASPAAAFHNGFVNDGFHPSASGYHRIIENALKQVMSDLLKELQ